MSGGRVAAWGMSACGGCARAARQRSKLSNLNHTMQCAALLFAQRCSSSHYHTRPWNHARAEDPAASDAAPDTKRIVASLAGALGNEPPRLKSEMFGCVDGAPRKSDYTAYILWATAAVLIGLNYVYSEYVDPTNWFNTSKNALAPGADLSQCPAETKPE